MPLVYKITDFAVHGGTAINLFHQNMPRYSVDIDLTYIYSPHYMSLIMVIEENSEIVRLNDTYRAMPQRLYVYDMLEQFRLVVVQNNVISIGGIYGPVISVEQFIEEAWQWYKNYLDWELKQMQGL